MLSKTFTQDYLLNALRVQDTSTSTVVLDRSHAFGDGINLTGITDNLTSARNEAYVYTAANRLQEGDGVWGTLNWTYDATGNRSSEVLTSGSSTTNTYNYPSGNNRLSAVMQGSTTVRSFSHDDAGNITADTRGSTTYNYRYNKRGRLDELTIGATVTADYSYDGLERLAIRATQNMTPAGTTHYVYDLAGHLIAESTDTGSTVREYVWLDDLPLAVVADIDTMSPNLNFVHADHLDRPLKMTDGTEAVVWDAERIDKLRYPSLIRDLTRIRGQRLGAAWAVEKHSEAIPARSKPPPGLHRALCDVQRQAEGKAHADAGAPPRSGWRCWRGRHERKTRSIDLHQGLAGTLTDIKRPGLSHFSGRQTMG